MTFTEFIKEEQRLTKKCTIGCDECRLSNTNNEVGLPCIGFIKGYPEEAEAIIEQWAKECPPKPKKTRQSEFLKLFPEARLINGIVDVCPYKLFSHDSNLCVEFSCICDNCR